MISYNLTVTIVISFKFVSAVHSVASIITKDKILIKIIFIPLHVYENEGK